MQARYGEIVFQQDLNGSTATTAYPSATTDGVGLPTTATAGRDGTRVHVLVRYQVALGTVSTDVHLYGLTGTTAGPGHWAYLASMNGGSSLTSTGPWAVNSSTVCIQERFELGHAQLYRLATRCINPQGTTPLVSTWIGYERG